MELTKFERVVLANQYRLLALADKGQKEHYDSLVEILDSGYELEYSRIFDGFLTEEPMAKAECSFVHDIFDMFSTLQRAYAQHKPKDIPAWKAQYSGFDGNHEGRYLGYARFLTETQGRWPELKGHDNHNSHCTSIPGYTAMVKVWKSMPDRHNLTVEQLSRVVAEWKGFTRA